jgi:hypothetical protein
MIRWLVPLAAALLAGCGSSPQSFGITGPGVTPAASPQSDDSEVPAPGISNTGNSYRYNIGPAGSGDRFFNYN